MNETPVANRLHIGIFGKRNAGKSSFLNALTSQELSIVSEIPGTTTDPVSKTMEIRGLGPVVFYDTAGIDDTSELGEKRINKTKQILNKINLAIIITTFSSFDQYEKELMEQLKNEKKQYVVVINKIDVEPRNQDTVQFLNNEKIPFIEVSCKEKRNIDEAKKMVVKIGSLIFIERDTIIGDLIKQGDIVVLVVPIDLGAPKGRLILPQVQVIRDILDNDAISMVVKERELEYMLRETKIAPNLVICDSQVVLKVVGDLSPAIKMTTFSILFSRLKGDLAFFVKSVKKIDELQDNDKVLILEACTHHALEDDIARVKIPRWVRQYTGKDIRFEYNAGPYVNKDMRDYKLAISCGGCMINRQEMFHRMEQSKDIGIPMTNYGVVISYVQGVLKRALSPFPFEFSLLEK